MYMKFTRFEVHAIQVLAELMAIKMRETGEKEKCQIAFDLTILKIKLEEIEKSLGDPPEIHCLLRGEEYDQ